MTPTASSEEALFQAALPLAGAQRGAFLDRACTGDPALRTRLEALLAAHDRPDTLFGTHGGATPRTIALDLAHDPAEDAVGQTIGRYTLVQKLGEGGCGVVYVAEQIEAVRRRVALKVIKLGMDTREVIARFEAERQALAMMDHPNIAKVLDAGTTDGGNSEIRNPKSEANPTSEFRNQKPLGHPGPSDAREAERGAGSPLPSDGRGGGGEGPSALPSPSRPLAGSPSRTPAGRPYFVMELVRGIKITDYCDQEKLSTQERLDLFIKVCQAIQHAHQKGIIHRDIKPSNILVTLHDGVPVPKVIDFGIAKATEGRLTDATVYTQLHQFIGTPAYMSPEQAEMSGLDIDTRSDIYSLGVLLYELLTGQTPFDAQELMSQGVDAMRRTIREKEPPRPSTRLTQERTTQKSGIRNPKSQIETDLDWIVMKCLEKDRGRRYATANGLAADLKRHLNHEPVVARPPSTAYRFQKAWRRNRLVFASAAAVGLALAGGTLFSGWQAVRAVRAEQKAIEARQDSDAIAGFLTEVLSRPDPSRDGRGVTIAETLDRAARKLEHDVSVRPARRATFQSAVAETYRALGLYRDAIPLLEKVRDYRAATAGRGHSNTVAVSGRLAECYGYVGRHQEARTLQEEVLAYQRGNRGPQHPDTLHAMDQLATTYEELGLPDKALALRREAIAHQRLAPSPDHRRLLGALRRQARLQATLGRSEEATTTFEELLELTRASLGSEDRETIWAMAELALAYADGGLHPPALALREDVLELSCRVLGPDHPDTLHAMDRLADSWEATGRVPGAVRLREDVVKQARSSLTAEHKYTLRAMTALALAYRAKPVGLDAAIDLLEEVVAVRRRQQGPKHRETLLAMHLLAGCYFDRGRTPDAVRQGEEVVALRREVLGPDHPETLWSVAALGEFYADARRFPEALETLEEVLEQRCRTLGGDHPDTLLATERLARASQLADCEDAAARWARDSGS